MACYYCTKRGSPNIPDVGTCQICGKHACGPPPKRSDKRFHGDGCTCQCGAFICFVHAAQHASTQHPTLKGCFGGLQFGAATTSLAACVTMIEVDRSGASSPGDVRDPVNDFLNFVSPGRTALQGASTHVLLAQFVEPLSNEFGLRFTEAFFSGTTLSRCAALAAREIACLVSPQLENFLVDNLAALEGRTLRALLQRHRPERPPVNIPPKKWMVDSLRDALRSPSDVVDLPTVPSNVSVADWLLEDAESGMAAY